MNVYFLLLPDIHLMDLSGPAQAFNDCNELNGEHFRCHYVSNRKTVASWQRLALSPVSALPPKVVRGSLIFIPGLKLKTNRAVQLVDREILDWLKAMSRQNARLIGICTGAFVLGAAGLLDGRKCTTHHRQLEHLVKEFPRAKVLHERMFVEDRGIYTSAGVTAGIDLSLHLISEILGTKASVSVAREMVVCSRRLADDPQVSPEFRHREHIHPTLHKAQDVIAKTFREALTLETLAAQLKMSSRQLQRLFRKATGLTFKQYVNEQRIYEAQRLLRTTSYPIELVAELSGFGSTRAFRDLWRKKFGCPPSYERVSSKRPASRSKKCALLSGPLEDDGR